MIKNLIRWAVHSRLVVLLLAAALMVFGIYSFHEVNVEAYPDPAPPIVEVVAQYPGASAEEVERQVTIPLEVALAGMPGLKYTRSQSLFGLSPHPQPVRLRGRSAGRPAGGDQPPAIRCNLPAGVTPQISPESPTGEIFRYTLTNPKDAAGTADLQPQRPEVAAGLDAGAAVPPRAADHRRGQLRRHGQTLRNPSRSAPAAALRHHARSSSKRGVQQQRQRRRRVRLPGRDGASGPQPGPDRPGRRPDGPGHGA